MGALKQKEIKENKFRVKGDGRGLPREKSMGTLNVSGVVIRVFELHVETYYNGNWRYFTRYQIDTEFGGSTRKLIEAAKEPTPILF